MSSTSSHFDTNASDGTPNPVSTLATCDLSHGISRANSACFSPVRSRKCFSTPPNIMAVVTAPPSGALRRLTATPYGPNSIHYTR